MQVNLNGIIILEITIILNVPLARGLYSYMEGEKNGATW